MNPSATRSEQFPSSVLSRRAFILMAGGLSLTSGCSTLSDAGYAQRPMVGSQLYGWSQYYDRDGKKIGEHVDEVLSAIRDCGYDYAEGTLDINRPENNGQFAERCKANGLRPVSFYTGGQLHEPGTAAETVQKTLEAAKVCR